MLNKLKQVKWRGYAKPFLIIFGIYCFSMLAIWRAGVPYVDDNGRAVTGKGWTTDFNRVSSSLLSFVLIQMRLKLTDISPLSQIIAMAFLAAATLIVVELFGKKERLSHLVAGSLIGLTPFTINLWLYQFDAPCMAMALLASVLPFVPRFKKQWHFSVFSFLCLMVMMTSYQAFAGVFPLILLALCFKDFLDKKSFNWKRIVFGLGGFLAALLFFKFALPEPHGYRSTEMLALADFIPGVFRNALGVYASIFKYFGINWLVVLAITLIGFLASIVINSKRKGLLRLTEVLSAVTFVLIAIPLSYGLLLALDYAPYNPRSLIGIGVALAIIAILALRGAKYKLFAVPITALVYLFCIYAFSLGNALKYQHEYANYRNAELAMRLSELYPSQEELVQHKIQIQGDIGLTQQANHVAELYPVTREIIDAQQTGQSYLFWGSWSLRANFGLDYNYLGSLDERYDCETMTVKFDGYYERISEEDNLVCIEIKFDRNY